MILKLESNIKLLSGRISDIGHVLRESKVGEKGRLKQTQWSHKVIVDLDRAWWDLPNDVSFKVIQARVQGHGRPKVRNPANFAFYLVPGYGS